jgi:hypothetical protein
LVADATYVRFRSFADFRRAARAVLGLVPVFFTQVTPRQCAPPAAPEILHRFLAGWD